MPTSQYRVEFLAEFENARSAIAWALSHDETILAARILVSFSATYRELGVYAEMRSRLDEVLGRLDADAQPALAARVWHALSYVVFGSRATEAARRAVELADRCNDPALTAWSLPLLAFTLLQAGHLQEAQAANDRALQLTRENGLTRSRLHGVALNLAGAIAHHRGRFDEARQLYAEGLSLELELGDEIGENSIRTNMAELEFQMGNTARALELVSAASTAEFIPKPANALNNSAAYQIALENIAAARISSREALRLARGAIVRETTNAIQHLATVAACSVDPRRAGRLRGYADAWYRVEGNKRGPTETRTYEILMAALREQLTDAEIETLAAEGAQLSEDQAVAEAMLI